MDNKISRLMQYCALLGGLLLSSYASSFDFCFWDCDRIVETSYGKVKGRSNSLTNAWYRIPYAAAPTGENRWQPPKPVKPWDGTKSASFSLSGCEQWASPTGVFSPFTSENCLDLSIWAPDKPGKYPVMVWIFGGGFLLGSGNELSYKGTTLSQNEDVVVVTLNHRLGPLGFLSLPGLTAEQGQSGNYGFLDQVAALKWVNNEIEGFGGDPENITVFGESAGGASVCMLMASPLSRHLFQNSIISSGPCGEWLTMKQEEADQKGAEFAGMMGCDQQDAAEQLACMRKLSPKEMRKKIDAPFNELFLVDGTQWKFFPYFTKDDHFINANFEDMISANKALIEQGALTPQNVIIGTVKDEGSLFEALKDHPEEADYKDYMTERFTEMKPEDIDNVLNLYPIDQYINVGHAMATISGDRNIVCAMVKTSKNLYAAGYPVFQYQFTEYSDSILRMITKFQLGTNPPPLGVFHSGEIGFLFGSSAPTSSLKTDEQKAVSMSIQDYMGTLARTGNPNHASAPNWPAYNDTDENYLTWGQDFTIGSDLRGHYCDYWIAEDFFADNF